MWTTGLLLLRLDEWPSLYLELQRMSDLRTVLASCGHVDMQFLSRMNSNQVLDDEIIMEGIEDAIKRIK